MTMIEKFIHKFGESQIRFTILTIEILNWIYLFFAIFCLHHIILKIL